MKYEWLEAGLSAPITVTWEVTYACNLCCRHCLSSSGRRHPLELSTDEGKRLIDDMAGLGVFYVNIGGGEPLVRPDFFELIEHAARRELPVQFSTNGTYVDEETARRLGDLGWNLRIQVSLDGATEAVNDAIRGPGSYAGALRALALLARQPIDEIWVNFVVTRLNFGDLDRMYQLAQAHGARLRVARLRPSGRGRESWEELHLRPEQHRALHEWLRCHPDVTTGDSYFILNALGGPLPGFNTCGAGRATCCVTPVGDVYPCAFLLGTDLVAGNVRERSLREIWETSPLFREFREAVVSECTACPAYGACGGGCRAVSYFVNGALHRRDPECVRVPEAVLVEDA